MKQLILYLLIFVRATFSIAQTNGQLIEQSLDLKIPFTVTRYFSKQGLPQSQVLNILPRDNGNLIIATAKGIVEHNGVEFKSFISEDLYNSRIINKLMRDAKTGTVFGEELNGHIHQLFPGYKSITGFLTSCVAHDSLFCIDTIGNIYGAPVNNLLFKKLYKTGVRKSEALLFESSGIYVGTTDGVYKYNFNSKSTFKMLSDVIRSFKFNPYNKCVYALCARNVYKIEGNSVTCLLTFAKGEERITFHDLAFVNDTVFFVASTQGLFKVTPAKTFIYRRESAIPTLYLQSLYYNKVENCLFVGTGDKGLLKLQFKNCYTLFEKEGFNPAASLSSIIKNKAGDVLVAGTDATIYKVDGDTVYPFLQTLSTCSSLSDIDDVLYVPGWGGGVKVFKNKKIIDTLLPPYNVLSGFSHAAFKDSRNRFWIGGDGVSMGTTADNIRPIFKTISDVTNIYELRNKNICIGGGDGVTILDSTTKIIAQMGRSQGMLSGKEVRCFYEDHENKLWIGTYGGGLYCYDRGKLTSINQLKNSKINEDVFCLAKDDFGYLYMTSNHGLWRIKEKDLDDFYYGRLKYLVPFYYCMETGILNEEFNGGFQNNNLRAAKSQFYFPSIQGIVRVTPELPHFRKLITSITQVLINDTLSAINNSSFDRKTYSIQFNFESVNFLNKYNVYYQYKLESGSSESWSPLQKNTSVSFKMLPPGNYTFFLRAVDAFNDRNPQETKYTFSIKPYLYETTWFRITFLFVLLVLSILIGAISVRRYRRKAIERERIKREVAELELKAVQAQMNPHFIFNSLNSIKHYLFINDTKSADIFIDTFSVLLRDFLEYSNKDFITLEKESDMLASYLSLESMRMNPPFSYKIDLPSGLNKIKVPTLLFQTFVENAVKHGITHSLKPCVIDINFRFESGTVICDIKDNGIGRKRSGEINQKTQYHTPKGIGIVNDKIKIIKETYGIVVEVAFEDQYPDNKETPGTIVTIKIPVQND